MSEWLKVMLGEIARKKEERAEALEEQHSRDGIEPPPAHEPVDDADSDKTDAAS